MKNIQLAIVVVSLVGAMSASASLTTFNITYDYSGVQVGAGSVQAADEGGGVYVVQSGSFSITAGTFVVPAGVYDFVFGPPPFSVRFNGPVLGPMDDQIQVSGGVPALSYDGILFTQPLDTDPAGYAPAGTIGINLWQNALSYAYADGPGGDTYGTMTVTYAPVPEASTIIAGALLLLPFGVSTLRILRKSRMA
jgi:hypothetical protein